MSCLPTSVYKRNTRLSLVCAASWQFRNHQTRLRYVSDWTTTRTKEIKVTGAAGTGTLRFNSQTKPICKQREVRATGNGTCELTVEKGKSYVMSYKG